MTIGFPVETLENNKSLKESMVARWGDFASDTMLDPAYKLFTIPEVNGAVAYKEDLGCAVIFGDPLCSHEDFPKLAQAFHAHCHENKLNVVYILSSEKFSKWAINNVCDVMIEVGEELVFDPFCDPLEGPRNKLRNKVNHAQHIGLTIHEYLKLDPDIEHQIQEVGNKWTQSRNGPQIYLANVDFFEDRTNKRWFYIKNSEGMIGVALLTRLEKREGWYLKFLLVLPDAPRGTSESLMTTILETLRCENCRFLTYGLVPGENLGEIVGVSRFTRWFAGTAFKIAKRIFRLEKRKGYWGQFLPKPERSYVLFDQPRVGIKEIRVVMKALKVEF